MVAVLAVSCCGCLRAGLSGAAQAGAHPVAWQLPGCDGEHAGDAHHRDEEGPVVPCAQRAALQQLWLRSDTALPGARLARVRPQLPAELLPARSYRSSQGPGPLKSTVHPCVFPLWLCPIARWRAEYCRQRLP